MAYVLVPNSSESEEETASLMAGYKSTDDVALVSAPDYSGQASGQKSKYPKGVFFIVMNEFCERFSYYGMRAILVLYLTDWLRYSDDDATAIYHFFVVLCYLSPLLGAILADGFWGKFRTILYISGVYGIGNCLMSLTALPPPHAAGPIISLLLIGLGTGGIKPCVSAFGGDQFSADQEKQLTQFFSVFYFAINTGSLLSTIMTPLIRQNISCFGTNCFSLAFGIPAVLMILSIILFVVGKPLYKIYPPPGNVIGRMIMCIGRALKNKCGSHESKTHWLDYAADTYEESFIADVRSVLRVFLMFLPLPIFWALFDQQGSRWILQAKKMDLIVAGRQIPPDLMPMINPLMILLLIPLFDFCIYPLFAKCNLLQKPLQRMVVGMFLASSAFVLAGILQIKLDYKLNSATPSGYVSMEIINVSPCELSIQSPWINSSLQSAENTKHKKALEGSYHLLFNANACNELGTDYEVSLDVTVEKDEAYYVVVYLAGGKLQSEMFQYPTVNPQHDKSYVSLLYLAEEHLPIFENSSGLITLSSMFNKKHNEDFSVDDFQQSEFKDIAPGRYFVQVHFKKDTVKVGNLRVKNGGIYTVIITTDNSTEKLALHTFEDVAPNDVSVLWQIIQYVIITMGEILFSISGLSFAYSQAPASMKSVVQAAWLMTVAVGNIVDVIVAGVHLLPSQASEFFFFAALMVAVTIVFAVMSYFYEYVDQTRDYEIHQDEPTVEPDNDNAGNSDDI